jgi:acetyltransferase-like isoleucine patch superfamily enzyme
MKKYIRNGIAGDVTISFPPDDGIIEASEIEIGNNVKFGKNIDIKVRGLFKVGDNSTFGDDVKIRGNNVCFGKHFFHLTPGLNIGGGGCDYGTAHLSVGDRCVFHNNYINIARPILIEDDVGLSPDVQIITHGFWESPLEGFPIKYGGVVIGKGSVIGQRSIILMSAKIPEYCVIGAQSVVARVLDISYSVYAGNPVKFLRKIEKPTQLEKEEFIKNLVLDFKNFIDNYKLKVNIEIKYPLLILDGIITFDVEKKICFGIECPMSDLFRDHLRRYGIKIYTERQFGNIREIIQIKENYLS